MNTLAELKNGEVMKRDGYEKGNSKPKADSLHGSLTDSELYKKCQEYGLSARVWMRKFAGLLPEVMQRHLYKKKGYISIYEFAAKLAGMSERSVDRILNLAEKLNDKPALRHLLETGKAGWSKLQTVASIATTETDQAWVEKIERLSQHSLEAYITAARADHGENNQQILQETLEQEKWNTLSFSICPATEKKLRLLKHDMEKENRLAIGWNEIMGELMKAFEENKILKKALEKAVAGKKIVQKTVTTNICSDCVKQRMDQREIQRETKRAIPVESEQIIDKRSGRSCEFGGCTKAGEIRHHVRRYALRKNHDPRYILWLCKAHEGIAQAGLIENEDDPPSMWHIRGEPDRTDLKFLIDEKVAEFRKEPATSTRGVQTNHHMSEAESSKFMNTS